MKSKEILEIIKHTAIDERYQLDRDLKKYGALSKEVSIALNRWSVIYGICIELGIDEELFKKVEN